MSVNRKAWFVVAVGACSLAAALVTFSCAAPPPGPAASSVPRRPDYLASGSPAHNEETAYTRELKRRVGAPPDAGGRGDQISANARRPPVTSLPSVSDFVNELYSPEAPTP